MSKRRFTPVTAILLLLLLAAIVNTYFVFHVDRGMVKPMEKPVPLTAAGQPAEPADARTLPGATAYDLVPNWHGEVSLVKAPGGGYDAIIEGLSNGVNANIPVTSVEADIRRPGDNTPVPTPEFKMTSVGKFEAHVNLAAGTWEVRVHIHRGLQTLEFAEKFDLKD